MKLSFRCSELDRTLLCNGSMQLVPLVDKRESEDGVEGTALHAISAKRLIVEYGAVGDPGETPKVAATGFPKWISDYYVRHVAETAPKTWGIECECALEEEFSRFTLTGHIDCVAISPDATEVIGWDLKTGYNPVDAAESNEQIAGYLVLLKAAYPQLQRATFFVIQPRNDEDDGFPRVSSLVLEGGMLVRVTAGFEARMNAAIGNASELNSGMKQCRFCSVGIQCPALKQDRDMAKLTMTQEAIAAINRQPNDDQLVEWVSVMRTLKPAAEAAEAALHVRLDATECVVGGGMTVTRKVQKGSIEVLDPVAIYRSAKEQLVTDERMAAAFKVSKSKLIDQLAEALNVAKTGAKGVTAASIWDAHFAVHCRQGERRLLQFSE